MTISQLSLTDFRNLRPATLDFHQGLNLICGENGSGKTSLLEAIHVLCRAQSFRTHQLKQCIHSSQEGFLLFGKFSGYQAGLTKSKSKLEIHLDGEPVERRSELVRQTPVNIANADSFELIDGSPKIRRRFLDWCLFHVEPEYADCWMLHQHALKQRNRLLKSRRDRHLVDYWDRHLIEPSLQISQMRQNAVSELRQVLDEELQPIRLTLDIQLEYQAGWSGDLSLAEALEQNRERDFQAGFTQVGIHRDDVILRVGENPAAEILSRGQGKRLCLAMLIGALKLVGRKSPKRMILLIDDLHSELDSTAQSQVYAQLLELDLQLFVSNIDTLIPSPLKGKEFKMFHVEHGTIKPRIFS